MALRKWHLKAFVQKALSFLPYGSSINFWFQKHITRGVRLTDDYIRDRLIHAKDHIKYCGEFGGKLDATLEIGTGWYPIIPLLLFLSGANGIQTLDVSRYVTRRRFAQTISKLLELNAQGGLAGYVEVVPDRLSQMRAVLDGSGSLKGMMAALSITYTIGDARRTSFPDKSLDLIHSNNTLEHIPVNVLRHILVELKRLGRPGAIHSHFIDMSDHFAHMDRTITPYNFLKFSSRKWKLINNRIQFMNRLRLSDYRQLFREAGYEIVRGQLRADRPGDLDSVKVHQELAHHDREELKVTHVHLVAV